MTLALIGARRTRGTPGSSPWSCLGHWHMALTHPGLAAAGALFQPARRMVSAGIRMMTAPVRPAVRPAARRGLGC